MGTSSLHSDNPLQPPKKRSFSLPSFRKPSGERPAEVETNTEEIARVRKAAAWQWYTRGVGEVVAPTMAASRPAVAPGHSPAGQVGDNSIRGDVINNSNEKHPQQEPQLPEPKRAASRFQTEASAPRPATTGAAPSPLYDEFELSGLRTHMADFVQRLQKQQKAQHELQGDQKTTAHSSTGAAGGLPAAAASTAAFYRPLTALHRFFRRVISGSIIKNTKNPPSIVTTDPSPAVQEPAFPRSLDEEEDSLQYHYHHYIHHHHHHYHYGNSSEDGASIIRRRRHSESSGIRPQIPSPWEEVEEDYGEEEEESPIQAYLARRRRHSDSFAGHNYPQKAVSVDVEEEGDPVKAVAVQLPRRYNSERFMSTTPNKIPVEGRGVSKEYKCEIDEAQRMQSTDIRSRRRHSAEILREGGSFKMKPGPTLGGGKTEGGTYKLGGAPGGAAPATTQVARRRHSEALDTSFRREMNDHMGTRRNRTPSPANSASMKVPMTPLWQSPHLSASRRHLEEACERQFSVPASADANLARPPLNHNHGNW